MANLRQEQVVAEPKGPQEFDPEITDMASYVHDYKIDSELAVCANFSLYRFPPASSG